MKLLFALALLPVSSYAAELTCSGSDLIYGRVASITLNEANAMNPPSLTVHYGQPGALEEDTAELNTSIAGGQTYLSKNGVSITLPAGLFSDSRPSLNVGLANYDYPYEYVSCQLE